MISLLAVPNGLFFYHSDVNGNNDAILGWEINQYHTSIECQRCISYRILTFLHKNCINTNSVQSISIKHYVTFISMKGCPRHENRILCGIKQIIENNLMG